MENQRLVEFVSHREGCISSIGVGPKSGLVVATGNNLGAVTVWALHATATPLRSFQMEKDKDAAVNTLRFDNTEELLLGSAGPLCKIWDLASGRLVRSFSPSESNITSAFFHPSAEVIGSSCEDQSVYIWDMRSKQTTHSIESAGTLLGFSPDGEHMFVAQRQSLDIYAWPRTTRSSSVLLKSTSPYENLAALACHPRRRHVAVASDCGDIWLLDVANGAVLRQWQTGLQGSEGIHLEFDRSGKQLLASAQQTLIAISMSKVEQPLLPIVLPTEKTMQIGRIASSSGLPLVFLTRSRTVHVHSLRPTSVCSSTSSAAAVSTSVPAASVPAPASASVHSPSIASSSSSSVVSSSRSPVEKTGDKGKRMEVPETPTERVRQRVRSPNATTTSASSPSASSSSSSCSTDDAHEVDPASFLRNHAETMACLAARLQTIRVVKSLWTKGMKTAALEQLAKANDKATTIDFLHAVQVVDKTSEGIESVTPTFITRMFTVEHYALLSPLLRQALTEGPDSFFFAAAQALVPLIKAFASSVLVGLRTGATPRSRAQPTAAPAVLKTASAEIVAAKKLLGSETNFTRRSSKVKSARRTIMSSLKTEFSLRFER